MTAAQAVRIDLWKPDAASLGADLDMLGDVLHSCVHAGASVSFVLPFSPAQAGAFWREQILPGVSAGEKRVLLARIGRRIVGTVQLDTATPPNQPHRADVKKLLVHPDARRRGIARSLMLAVEQHARAAHRSLLTLDTVTGSPAERLYLALGYVALGVIPRYALNFNSSLLETATFMYKEL
jgi:GNAT superfamily N-acetyltransferase